MHVASAVDVLDIFKYLNDVLHDAVKLVKAVRARR